MDAFLALVALLGLEGEGGDRAGVEALQGDRLAGFRAEASSFTGDRQRKVVSKIDAALRRAVGLLGGAVAFQDRALSEW